MWWNKTPITATALAVFIFTGHNWVLRFCLFSADLSFTLISLIISFSKSKLWAAQKRRINRNIFYIDKIQQNIGKWKYPMVFCNPLSAQKPLEFALTLSIYSPICWFETWNSLKNNSLPHNIYLKSLAKVNLFWNLMISLTDMFDVQTRTNLST